MKRQTGRKLLSRTGYLFFFVFPAVSLADYLFINKWGTSGQATGSLTVQVAWPLTPQVTSM